MTMTGTTLHHTGPAVLPRIHRLPRIAAILLLVLIAGCSEDGPVHRTHFFHPQWTADDSIIVAAMYDNPDEQGSIPVQQLPISSFVVLHRSTGRRTVIPLPLGTLATRYWIDREGHIVTNGNGLTFYSTAGTELAVYLPPRTGLNPVHVSFAADTSLYVYAASSAGRLVVGSIAYASVPWQPGAMAVLLDTATTASVLDIALTSSSSYAVRLSDGAVLEYDFAGRMLHMLTVTPVAFRFPWHARINVFGYAGAATARDKVLLFLRDGRGLVVDTLMTGRSGVLVEGHLMDFDINPVVSQRQMVYETGSGDIWLATLTGLPLARLLPHNVQASISHDGHWISAVGTVNSTTDTLTVMKLF